MADLSTLDPTQPPGTQAVSQGDDRIRETREAIIESFAGAGFPGTGGTQAEHFLNGAHRFEVRDPSGRPAAGNAGRLFFDSTNRRAEFDTGAAWGILHTVQSYKTFVVGSVALAVAGVDIVTVVVNKPVDGRMLVLGYASMAASASSSSTIGAIYRDGNQLEPTGQSWNMGIGGGAMFFVGSDFSGASGDVVVSLRLFGNPSLTVSQRFIAAVVL